MLLMFFVVPVLADDLYFTDLKFTKTVNASVTVEDIIDIKEDGGGKATIKRKVCVTNYDNRQLWLNPHFSSPHGFSIQKYSISYGGDTKDVPIETTNLGPDESIRFFIIPPIRPNEEKCYDNLIQFTDIFRKSGIFPFDKQIVEFRFGFELFDKRERKSEYFYYHTYHSYGIKDSKISIPDNLDISSKTSSIRRDFFHIDDSNPSNPRIKYDNFIYNVIPDSLVKDFLIPEQITDANDKLIYGSEFIVLGLVTETPYKKFFWIYLFYSILVPPIIILLLFLPKISLMFPKLSKIRELPFYIKFLVITYASFIVGFLKDLLLTKGIFLSWFVIAPFIALIPSYIFYKVLKFIGSYIIKKL